MRSLGPGQARARLARGSARWVLHAWGLHRRHAEGRDSSRCCFDTDPDLRSLDCRGDRSSRAGRDRAGHRSGAPASGSSQPAGRGDGREGAGEGGPAGRVVAGPRASRRQPRNRGHRHPPDRRCGEGAGRPPHGPGTIPGSAPALRDAGQPARIGSRPPERSGSPLLPWRVRARPAMVSGSVAAFRTARLVATSHRAAKRSKGKGGSSRCRPLLVSMRRPTAWPGW